MSEQIANNRTEAAETAIGGLHLFALFTLAVAHPLYAVLGQVDHAPFFIAHQSQSADIFGFVLIYSLAAPLFLWVGIRLVGLFSKSAATGLFLISVFILIWLALLPVPGRWLEDPGVWGVVLPAFTAVVATALYRMADWARSFLTIMSLAIIISPIMLISTPSVRSLLKEPAVQNLSDALGSRNRPDIVMMVFDELPLISLLDDDLEIDSARYPNFHRLARTATWYKNATAQHLSTSFAIRSLLVGTDIQSAEDYHRHVESALGIPKPKGGPADRDNIPFNLFSMLESEYRIYAKELMTKLAPVPPEHEIYLPPLRTRLTALLLDSLVVYTHLVTPEALKLRFPQIEGQWGGFLATETHDRSESDWQFLDSYQRSEQFRSFLESIELRNAPSFYFLHSLLPHYPFAYNERGQTFTSKLPFLTMHFREATGRNDWPDEQSANLSHQAHLLQLAFTDRLLGLVLDRLEQLEKFQDTLIIVTSDHGTNYYWDREGMEPDELAEIQATGSLYIPLIIKFPGQASGRVSNIPLQTTDLVPTIADFLDVEVTWPVSGRSAIGDIPSDRVRQSYLPHAVSVPSVLERSNPALRRKLELFGRDDIGAIYHFGPYREIVNMPLSAFPSEPVRATFDLKHPGAIRTVDPTGMRLPAYVDGQLIDLPEGLKVQELALAVAVNGIIRSTTTTTLLRTSSLRPQGRSPVWHDEASAKDGSANAGQHGSFFLALLPPTAFEKGKNEISIHVIVADETSGEISLLDLGRD
jgi:hypothetical protein